MKNKFGANFFKIVPNLFPASRYVLE